MIFFSKMTGHKSQMLHKALSQGPKDSLKSVKVPSNAEYSQETFGEQVWQGKDEEDVEEK